MWEAIKQENNIEFSQLDAKDIPITGIALFTLNKPIKLKQGQTPEYPAAAGRRRNRATRSPFLLARSVVRAMFGPFRVLLDRRELALQCVRGPRFVP